MYEQLFRQFFRCAAFEVERWGSPHFILSKDQIGQLRELKYAEQWRKALTEEWFHIRLADHSLFLFDESGPSYTFYQSPVVVPTFREFLHGRGEIHNRRTRQEFSDEYEMELITAPFREHLTPIRYDYHVGGYRAGVHPVAHLHIGLENNVRIGLPRMMSPASFVFFVMRHVYPSNWERLVKASSNLKGLERLIRSSLLMVKDDHWQEVDQVELFLS